MKTKLTATNLKTLPPGDYPDHVLANLKFCVGAKRRTWRFRYRAGGKQPNVTIGYFIPDAPEGSDSLGLAAARDKAREILGRVEAGVVDGAEDKPKKVQHPKDAKTLGDVIDAYEVMRRTKGERIKSLDLALRTVRAGLKKYLNLPARSFSKHDLRAARDVIAKRALQQSSAFQRYLGPIMKWASAEDHIEHDFSRDVLKVAAIAKRDRVLSHSEIAAIWHSAGSLKGERGEAIPNFGRLVQFLLLTAQRKDEGASLKHGDIIDGRWKQVLNKSSRPHVIKLPKAALDIVGDGEANEFVFAGRLGKIGGFSKAKAKLDEASGVKNWRLHDLRRTAASEMQEIGVEPHAIEAVLNHAMPGVGAVYMRGQLEALKASALEKWATELAFIVEKKPHGSKQA